jgi:hypothetical protein
MKLDARLKKLEEKVRVDHGMWATFTMKNYEDSVERGKVKQRLLDEYVAQGNPVPLGCIYWNEICPDLGNSDKFTGSYLTNPVADIMERIALNAVDPLERTE